MAKKKKTAIRFSGREGAFFSDSLLKKWIQNHEDHNEVRAHFFGKDVLLKTLNQPGCVGIRFYHAINDQGQKILVFVGADAKGASLWTTGDTSKKLKVSAAAGGGNGGWPCPPYC